MGKHKTLPFVSKESVLLSLIDLIYEAVSEPAVWSIFLKHFADAVHGTRTAIFFHDIRNADGSLVWTANVDPEYLRLYNDYYHAKNLWAIRASSLLAPGRVVTSEEMCPAKEVLRSEYYADYLRPQDIFYPFGAEIIREGSRAAIITVMRPLRAAPFGPEEVAFLNQLMPHLQRAFQLRCRLDHANLEKESFEEALAKLAIGVVIVEGKGQIAFMNSAAEQILKSGDGLIIEEGQVKAVFPKENARLQALLGKAVQTAESRGSLPGGSLAVTRSSAKAAIEVLVVPVRFEVNVLGSRRARSLIFISDPERGHLASRDFLRTVYGLTPAESDIVNLLLQGKDVDEICDVLSITGNTARTHLKHIFSKTGTRRQSELIRILLLGPASVRVNY